jgi:hypothetical protein
MTLNNFVNVALVAMILFFAASIGFVLHRIDTLDARVSNIEAAR